MKCKDCQLFQEDPYYHGRALWSIDGDIGKCCKDPAKVERKKTDPGYSYGLELKEKADG